MNVQKKAELLDLAPKNLNTCIILLDECIFGLNSEEYYRNNLLGPMKKLLHDKDHSLDAISTALTDQ